MAEFELDVNLEEVTGWFPPAPRSLSDVLLLLLVLHLFSRCWLFITKPTEPLKYLLFSLCYGGELQVKALTGLTGGSS